MMFFYHFPLLLVQIVLYQGFQFTNISYKRKTGIITIILIILYPSEITSISFLLPTLYRYSFLFRKDKKYALLFNSFLLQSLIFQSLNPLKSIFYPFLSKVYGLLHLLSFIDLFCKTSLSLYLSSFLALVFEKIEIFTFKGSVVGSGMILFVIVLFVLRKRESFYRIAIFLLFLFLSTGLFHPLPELTIINVGQGDSILLRGALNTTNILIDTGKESAYASLESFLDAKGVKYLDALIISHPDEDHNGNQESVMQDFYVNEVIATHFDQKQLGDYLMYDVNTIQNDDTN